MSKHGIESIHAPMCKHIASHKGKDDDSLRLFSLLEGTRRDVTLSPTVTTATDASRDVCSAEISR